MSSLPAQDFGRPRDSRAALDLLRGADAGNELPASNFADFRFGPWLAQPTLNRLASDQAVRHLRPHTMDVLVHLALRAPLVVSREELLQAVWPNQHIEDEGLTHCVGELREALRVQAAPSGRRGDAAAVATVVPVIETIPKRGYRLMATVRWSMPARAASSHRCGLVVLPLDDIGPDHDECFCRGLTEALLASLAAIPGLRVVSRTSATRLEPGLDLRAIAGKLNVSHALEGAIRRSNGRALVTIRLVDAPGDAQLWGRTFIDDGSESLAVQERTASEVAAAVQSMLEPRDAV